MNRKMFRWRPEFESMESIVLLSAVSIAGRSGAAAVAELKAKSHSILLSGTVSGTYSVGGVSGVGENLLRQGLDHPSWQSDAERIDPAYDPEAQWIRYDLDQAGQGLRQAGPNGVGSPVFYTITGGTGKLAGVSGTGEALITIVPAKRGGRVHGTLTITFTTAIVPTVTSETPASAPLTWRPTPPCRRRSTRRCSRARSAWC